MLEFNSSSLYNLETLQVIINNQKLQVQLLNQTFIQFKLNTNLEMYGVDHPIMLHIDPSTDDFYFGGAMLKIGGALIIERVSNYFLYLD